MPDLFRETSAIPSSPSKRIGQARNQALLEVLCSAPSSSE